MWGLLACVHDDRELRAAQKDPARSPSGLVSRSQGLCSLIGPHTRNPGIWGADLGYTARTRDSKKLEMLFGDTWASPVDGCQYPGDSSNDLQASLPVERPAEFAAGDCKLLEYERAEQRDPTSWPHIRLFSSASARAGDRDLDLSGLRTPIAAFSDGDRMLALFQRLEPAECSVQADCPSGMSCSSEPGYSGPKVGECSRLIDIMPDDAGPDYCRDENDCVPGSSCDPLRRGVCMTLRPFDAETPRGRVAPSWYRDDPKRALSSVVYVGAAIWPERPSHYATIARFKTNRFQNAAARTVAYFDPEHPEWNDYSPGHHTLLVWGRNNFVENSGAQALPFLLYVPLDELRGSPESVVWKPRFFAGYNAEGAPKWSEVESDARPIYGDRAHFTQTGKDTLAWSEPEFDSVAQMALSWVAPLSRWVMFYGGDLPAFMVLDPSTGHARKPVHKQRATGAIHMRVSPHPWGPARAGAGELGWSSAEPVLTRELAAPYLACGSEGPSDLPGCHQSDDGFRPFVLLGALADAAWQAPAPGFFDVAKRCVVGELARQFQETLSGNPIGRLYAPNIIDEWTQEVTDDADRARNVRSVELYWNVSTWNPYQVALFKTRLSAGPGSEPTRTAQR
ncbi:MAG TPA: hypothetical protein VJR89_16790 [Polyangiales bacterium]|nr:hypothetical protein [Polyangiales bacterium]